MSVEVNLETYEITVVVDYAEKGDTGKSAYQYAVEQGFVGTELEWIESLKQPAIDAAIAANAAAENANEKAQLADQSAQGAIEAASIANTATEGALSATESTIEATSEAVTATNEAIEAKEGVLQAIVDAQGATTAANAAATNADEKANLANQSAINADEKANLADAAANSVDDALEGVDAAVTSANTATSAANAAALNANNAAGVAMAQRAYVNYLFGITQDETDAIMEFARLQGYKPHSSLYLKKLDGFIRDLKSFGLWDKMDLTYWMVGDGDLNFKTINIIDPAKSGAPIGGLMNTLQGIEGNGVDAYVDTNIFLDTPGLKYQLNNAHRMLYVLSGGGRSLAGTENSIDQRWFRSNNAQASYLNSRNTFTPGLNTLDNGFHLMTRADGENLTYVLNTEEIALRQAGTSTSTIAGKRLRLLYANGEYGSTSLQAFTLGAYLAGQGAQNFRQVIINNL